MNYILSNLPKIIVVITNFFVLISFIIHKVLPNDIDDVAAEILAGVEEAMLYKKKQYVSTNVQNLQKFSLEVNFVIQ